MNDKKRSSVLKTVSILEIVFASLAFILYFGFVGFEVDFIWLAMIVSAVLAAFLLVPLTVLSIENVGNDSSRSQKVLLISAFAIGTVFAVIAVMFICSVRKVL